MPRSRRCPRTCRSRPKAGAPLLVRRRRRMLRRALRSVIDLVGGRCWSVRGRLPPAARRWLSTRSAAVGAAPITKSAGTVGAAGRSDASACQSRLRRCRVCRLRLRGKLAVPRTTSRPGFARAGGRRTRTSLRCGAETRTAPRDGCNQAVRVNPRFRLSEARPALAKSPAAADILRVSRFRIGRDAAAPTSVLAVRKGEVRLP
jgi:hypothetical protein